LDLRVILSLQMLSLNSASFPEKKRVEGDKTSNSSHEASQRMKLVSTIISFCFFTC